MTDTSTAVEPTAPSPQHAPSTPPADEPTEVVGLLRGTNPVARILGLILLTTPLLISVDLVSATMGLVSTIIIAIACRTSIKKLLLRGLPILIAAPFSGLSMLLYGKPEGQHYFDWGWIHITSNSVELAAAIIIRIIAVGFPAIIFIVGMDPTTLGDGLAQVAHLPSRFVIGAVASFRLASLFLRDWQALGRARRSRGLSDTGRVSRFASMVFSLLVLALRRGGKLATAMEARGFGASKTRTWGRVSTFGRADIVVISLCVALSATAIILSVATGAFRFLGT